MSAISGLAGRSPIVVPRPTPHNIALVLASRPSTWPRHGGRYRHLLVTRGDGVRLVLRRQHGLPHLRDRFPRRAHDTFTLSWRLRSLRLEPMARAQSSSVRAAE